MPSLAPSAASHSNRSGRRTTAAVSRRAAGVAAALVLCAPGPVMAGPTASSTSRSAATPSQRLALLDRSVAAFAHPNQSAKPVATVLKTRPITGQQTALPVIARSTDRLGQDWLRVLLPGRPNSHSGWILARSTTPAVTDWRIAISLRNRTVSAVLNGRIARTFKAVIGKPSTPTPTGRFFIEETVRLGQQDIGAPYALALSARSNVLQEFAGGPGQVALHGTSNVGGVLGTAASHGCIRLTPQAITWLATRLTPGTPVTITQ